MAALSETPVLRRPAPFEYALEAVEETVLVRLGRKGFEYDEYADELVEALEACRSGLDVDVVWSVCDLLNC